MRKKIVLTGGPCGGKSTCIDFLRNKYGNKIRFVNEAATMLMSSGFPSPGRDLTFSSAWAETFQDAIIGVQIGNEGASEIAAIENGSSVIICDRGILDSAAYINGGLPVLEERYLKKYGLSLESIYDRYTMVIHLESLATGNPPMFGKIGNEVRYESLEEAQALELRIRKAWQGHPNWHFVEGSKGLDHVLNCVSDLVSPYINKEIERKFLLKNIRIPALLEDGQIPSTASQLVRQKYILSNPFEMRIRSMGLNSAFIGIKGSGGLSRDAWEESLPYNLFQELYKQVDSEEVVKLRYYVPYNDKILEVDIYDGRLSGLVILECEFSTEEEATQFELPDWAECSVEVTDDPNYKNKTLALNGLPKGWR